ncbi:MAG: hypothetical protein WKG07_11890 [Hymenobacter sp.]
MAAASCYCARRGRGRLRPSGRPSGLNAGPAANDGDAAAAGPAARCCCWPPTPAPFGALTVTAHGGQGGNANTNGAQPGAAHGPGGGGARAPCSPATRWRRPRRRLAGANGTTTTGALAFRATGRRLPGILPPTPRPAASARRPATPALTAAPDSTSTPGVTRTEAVAQARLPQPSTRSPSPTRGRHAGHRRQRPGQHGQQLVYGTTARIRPSRRLPCPTAAPPRPPATALPANGVSQPMFTGFVLPAGASLAITFRATIDASAQNGVAYQASAVASYDNPLRTSAATATAQPGQNYTGTTDPSLGTAGGGNYGSSSSTAEDVTIQVPLRVSLSRFDGRGRAPRRPAALDHRQRTQQRPVRDWSAATAPHLRPLGTVRGQGNSSHAFSYAFLDAGPPATLAGQPLPPAPGRFQRGNRLLAECAPWRWGRRHRRPVPQPGRPHGHPRPEQPARRLLPSAGAGLTRSASWPRIPCREGPSTRWIYALCRGNLPGARARATSQSLLLTHE